MTNSAEGGTYVFPTNTDGQVAGSPTHTYFDAGGLAMDGRTIYMARYFAGNGGSILTVDGNGAILSTVVSTGLTGPLAIVVNPTNHHLFVSNGVPIPPPSAGIVEVDPIARTVTPFVHVDVDGLAISANGSTLYGANLGTGHILGFNTSSKDLVFDSGFIPGGVDGNALGYGTLSGKIYVNTNAGQLIEIDLATKTQTVIGTGGSRGDFVTVDPNNGSLLITQTDRILRLTAAPGGSFAVPEPGSLVSLVLGLAGVAGYTKWKPFRSGAIRRE